MLNIIRNKMTMYTKWIHRNQLVYLTFVSIFILSEVLLFQFSSDFRLFLFLGVYWYIAKTAKLSRTRVFQLCIILLVSMAIGYLTRGATSTTERLAVWFVLFFALGIFTQWREIAA